MSTNQTNQKLGHTDALALLAKHSLTLTIVLLLIFSLALALDLLARGLVSWEWIEEGGFFQWCLLFARTLLLGVDLVLFSTLVLAFGWRALKKIILQK